MENRRFLREFDKVYVKVDFVGWRTAGSLRVRQSRTPFLDSSMVEHSAVNRVVVGSSPTRGAEEMKNY